MNKKIALITGASSGIGRETALYFAKKGWLIAATMRKPEGEKELQKHENIELFALDVHDKAQIQSVVDTVIKKWNKIDVLINNAGYGALGIFEAASEEQMRRQFETNVFGLMRMTKAVLPYMRTEKSGCIVNISSIAGRVGFPLFSLYNASKWAVEGFSESLFYEAKSQGIRVKIVEPGPIKTDFYGRSMDFIQSAETTDYTDFLEKGSSFTQKTGSFGFSPRYVARTIYKAARSKSSKLRYPSDPGAHFILFLHRITPAPLFRWIMGMLYGKRVD